MGKFNFSKTIEHTFKNHVEFIYDIIEEFNTGKDVVVAVTWEKVPEIIRGVLSNTRIVLYDVNFAYPEINGYSKEYLITLCHGFLNDDDVLFVEQAYIEELDKYLSSGDDSDITAFVSQDMGMSLYERFVEDNCNIVLFDLETDR